MNVIDKILNEWAYRCSDGIVDLNNPEKKAILDKVLKEFNISKINEVESSEIDQIINTLQETGLKKDALVPIRNILANYDDKQFANFKSKFRSFNIDNVSKIFKNFKDFYNITFKGLGAGEVMMIIGVKDSKSGGTATKDIEVNGKVYEVKELAIGEFSLASDGYITGTNYLTHLNSFKQHLTPGVVSFLNLPQEQASVVLKTINYYEDNGPNNASRGFLNNLIETCKILKEGILNLNLKDINYITVAGKKIIVSKEDYEKIKSGSGPVTVSFGEEVEESRGNTFKLKNHPWVKDSDYVKIDLYEIWELFLNKIDGMVFFKYSSSPEGILMNTEEVNKNFIPFRIALNTLVAKDKSFVKKEKEIVEEEN